MKTMALAAVLLIAAAPSYPQGLRAGYAKVDITPTGPVYMGGYDLRDAPSDGIHGNDRLYVRALVFEQNGTRIAFVMADVIGIYNHDSWRSKISEATGIPAADILLGDVHDHAAPSPYDKRNAEWVKQFEPALLAAVRDANARLEPVHIAAATGHSRIAMNRRQVRTADTMSTLTFDENDRSQTFGKSKTDKPVEIREFAGVVRLGANPDGPIDDKVQVVRIDSTSGKPIAVMIHYACHGTSLGGRNSKISGEWMGRMQEYVEKQFPGVGSIYFQGAAGDINPRVVGGLDGYQDDVKTTWALGEEIGTEVARVYRSLSPLPPTNTSIQLETRDILLPRQYRELFEDFSNTVVKVPTTAVRIGDLMWVNFPGEMFHAIGERVRAAEPATHAHILGYTNGYVGYFPEQKTYAEGGYEVATTHLDPAAEQVYMREIAELLKRFH
jgi:Neutral/alkaline non-lysosomal ceramidase, N-terminal